MGGKDAVLVLKVRMPAPTSRLPLPHCSGHPHSSRGEFLLGELPDRGGEDG